LIEGDFPESITFRDGEFGTTATTPLSGLLQAYTREKEGSW